MTSRQAALALLCVLLTAGCDMVVMPWQKSSLKESAGRILTCEAGSDCDRKWARALEWVRNNAAIPSVHTDILIQSGSPGFASPLPVITINKTQVDDDTYVIDFAATCNNILGCTPPVVKLKASFMDYVTKTPKKSDWFIF